MNNLINIVSFNILNPNYLHLLFKNYIKDKNKINELVKIEIKEFKKYRIYKLLEIIDYWINLNQIVCLQEVNTDLLKLINKKYKNNNTNDNIDNRVTIIPKQYSIIKSEKLIFDNGIKIKECLISHIKYTNYSSCKKNICLLQGYKKFIIFNLHIHWKSKEKDYAIFANQIKEYINNYKSIPFIICGDFNCSINSTFMISFNQNINYKLNTNSELYLNNYTSFDIKNKGKHSWIDHIFSYDMVTYKSTQTTKKVKNYKIFYNVKKIIKYYTKNDITLFNSPNFISDHLPIYACFIIN